eukprot:Amastigsp_a858468_3.p4 type:complete len:112 gc:universal Amastigsp_a858468_3:78-413(+)
MPRGFSTGCTTSRRFLPRIARPSSSATRRSRSSWPPSSSLSPTRPLASRTSPATSSSSGTRSSTATSSRSTTSFSTSAFTSRRKRTRSSRICRRRRGRCRWTSTPGRCSCT